MNSNRHLISRRHSSLKLRDGTNRTISSISKISEIQSDQTIKLQNKSFTKDKHQFQLKLENQQPLFPKNRQRKHDIKLTSVGKTLPTQTSNKYMSSNGMFSSTQLISSRSGRIPSIDLLRIKKPPRGFFPLSRLRGLSSVISIKNSLKNIASSSKFKMRTLKPKKTADDVNISASSFFGEQLRSFCSPKDSSLTRRKTNIPVLIESPMKGRRKMTVIRLMASSSSEDEEECSEEEKQENCSILETSMEKKHTESLQVLRKIIPKFSYTKQKQFEEKKFPRHKACSSSHKMKLRQRSHLKKFREKECRIPFHSTTKQNRKRNRNPLLKSNKRMVGHKTQSTPKIRIKPFKIKPSLQPRYFKRNPNRKLAFKPDQNKAINLARFALVTKIRPSYKTVSYLKSEKKQIQTRVKAIPFPSHSNFLEQSSALMKFHSNKFTLSKNSINRSPFYLKPNLKERTSQRYFSILKNDNIIVKTPKFLMSSKK